MALQTEAKDAPSIFVKGKIAYVKEIAGLGMWRRGGEFLRGLGVRDREKPGSRYTGIPLEARPGVFCYPATVPFTRGSSTLPRIVIADDHVGTRKAIRSEPELRPDLEVSGEASNGEEAVQEALRVAPDLVILDIMMPNRDGFSAAREIRQKLPKVPILMVSTRDDEEMIAASKVAGAQGFVSKLDVPVVLLDAVEALLQGRNYFPNGTHPE